MEDIVMHDRVEEKTTPLFPYLFSTKKYYGHSVQRNSPYLDVLCLDFGFGIGNIILVYALEHHFMRVNKFCLGDKFGNMGDKFYWEIFDEDRNSLFKTQVDIGHSTLPLKLYSENKWQMTIHGQFTGLATRVAYRGGLHR